jgi:hypothetical protein
MTVETAIVAETPDIGRATFLHEVLVGAGIEAELINEGGATVWPGTDAGKYVIVVDAAVADAARALLEEAESVDASAAAEAAEAEAENEAAGTELTQGGAADEA